jgi:hypothetical protein
MQGMGERFRNRLPLPARDCPLECLGKAWGVLTEAQEQRGGLPFGFIRFNHDGRQLLELVAFPHGHIQEHSGLPEVELGLFELPALPSLARGALVLGLDEVCDGLCFGLPFERADLLHPCPPGAQIAAHQLVECQVYSALGLRMFLADVSAPGGKPLLLRCSCRARHGPCEACAGGIRHSCFVQERRGEPEPRSGASYLPPQSPRPWLQPGGTTPREPPAILALPLSVRGRAGRVRSTCMGADRGALTRASRTATVCPCPCSQLR